MVVFWGGCVQVVYDSEIYGEVAVRALWGLCVVVCGTPFITLLFCSLFYLMFNLHVHIICK